MTAKKTVPLVLVMFTVMCALPAGGAMPSAIAQEEDDEDEDEVFCFQDSERSLLASLL